MKEKQAGPGYVALITAGNPGGEEAAALVQRALRRRGEKPWEAMEIELYPGGEESLLIARPARGKRIFLSLGALAFLAGEAGRES